MSYFAFDASVREALRQAANTAAERSRSSFDTMDLLEGLRDVEPVVAELLLAARVEVAIYGRQASTAPTRRRLWSARAGPSMGRDVGEALKAASVVAKEERSRELAPRHVLIGLCATRGCDAQHALAEAGVTTELVAEAFGRQP